MSRNERMIIGGFPTPNDAIYGRREPAGDVLRPLPADSNSTGFIDRNGRLMLLPENH